MRKLSSFIKKYGPVAGSELLTRLQQRSSGSRWSLYRVNKCKKKHNIKP